MFYETKKYFGRSGITIGCPKCGGRSKKNGHFRGRQRYLCLSCRCCFVKQKHLSVSFKDFSDFYRLVIGDVNRHQLTKDKHICRWTLSVRFKVFFNKPLYYDEVWKVLPPKLVNPWVYGVDGKWLKRQGVFILHRNITTKENLYCSFHLGETYSALSSDSLRLTELIGGKRSYPVGVISDWKGAIVSSVGSCFGDIPHQRCLTHVTRTLKILLPKKSPFLSTVLLRNIALKLIHLQSQEEIEVWFKSLASWHDRYGHRLKERTINQDKTSKHKWWYTHSKLRRAWRLLTKNPEPFFKHLSHELLPHSNNSLEGTISQAVNKLINHRGMKLHQQISFLRWYFTFSRVKNKQDLKKLWAYWKSVNNSV